jgi:hypothetical protein
MVVGDPVRFRLRCRIRRKKARAILDSLGYRVRRKGTELHAIHWVSDGRFHVILSGRPGEPLERINLHVDLPGFRGVHATVQDHPILIREWHRIHRRFREAAEAIAEPAPNRTD